LTPRVSRRRGSFFFTKYMSATFCLWNPGDVCVNPFSSRFLPDRFLLGSVLFSRLDGEVDSACSSATCWRDIAALLNTQKIFPFRLLFVSARTSGRAIRPFYVDGRWAVPPRHSPILHVPFWEIPLVLSFLLPVPP